MDKNLHQHLLEKKEYINRVAGILKTEFIGIDKVIDEVCRLILPWYLFPDAQLRPMVINLWGLTGSGKTALIHRLVDLLDYRKLYAQLDMGEYESDSAGWIKSLFTDDLEHFNEKPVMICFDEFQFARTIGSDGQELGKDKLRVVWELLDSGKISYIPNNNSFYVMRAELCRLFLAKCREKDVEIQNGVVVKHVEEFMYTFSEFWFDNYNRYGDAVTENYFLSRDFIEGAFTLHNDELITKQETERIIKKSDIDGIIRFLEEGIRKRSALKQFDLSKALVFITGNLDEAYWMSDNMNPDISADDFYEATTKINIAHIKAALQKRFRNEQVARLGNNHVIYPSLNNAHYREFIRRQLDAITQYVADKFNTEFIFDETIIDLVYREGVYPAQGTRPVITTVKNLIESRVGRILIDVISLEKEIRSVEWIHSGNSCAYLCRNAGGNVVHTMDETIELKVDALRKPANPGLQAHTAVHESGHAVLAALTLRILPSVVVSKTASANCEGFCMVNYPEELETRDTLKKSIIIGLGGFVAEKMIFGEENTSTGVQSDIQRVTDLANKAIRQYAMGSDPVKIAIEHNPEVEAFHLKERHAQEAMQLINECREEAECILERNKLLLLKMSEYLTYHARMEEKTIGDYVKEYAADEWVRTEGFKKKENYFSFNAMVTEQLSGMERSIPKLVN